ncbi:MAG: dihydrofolate reductase [Microbacterium pygmaeum]
MTRSPIDARIGLIWAQAEGCVIGRDGGMPWHVPEDLAHFKEITLGSPVVMGRATWDSLGAGYRPLPGRRNIVVTRQADWSAPGAETTHSIEQALQLAARDRPETIWVIGGGAIFGEVLDRADVLEVTQLQHPGGFAAEDGDVRAPRIDPAVFASGPIEPGDGWDTSRSGIRYRFLRYERMPPA